MTPRPLLTDRHLKIPAAMARRFVRRFGLPPGADLTDLEGEAAIGLMESARRWREDLAPEGSKEPGPWLARGAHQALLRFRQSASYRKRRPVPTFGAQIPLVPDSRPGPEQAACAGERAEHVARLLRSLPPRHAELLRLRYWEGLRYSDIARLWGVTGNAVEQMAKGIIRRLRDRHHEDI